MAQSEQANLGVECVVLAVYCLITAFSAILYFGRKSYKCCLLPFTKTQMMSRTKASRQLGTDIVQRWWLDLLVSTLFFATILRTIATVLRVADFGLNVASDSNQLYTATRVMVLVSLTTYSLVFCALIWMWLRLSLTFFEEDDKKRNCILWTVRVTTIACIVTTFIVLVGLVIVYSINLQARSSSTFWGVVIILLLLYVASLAALCTVVVVLGIRLAVLIKKTTESSQSATLESEGDRTANRNRRTALTKISVAVIAFIIALVVRGAGTALFVVPSVIPRWISSPILISMPEFVTFSVLIGILWPFRVKCCIMYDESSMEERRAEGAAVPMAAVKLEEVTTSESPAVSVSSPSSAQDASASIISETVNNEATEAV